MGLWGQMQLWDPVSTWLSFRDPLPLQNLCNLDSDVALEGTLEPIKSD